MDPPPLNELETRKLGWPNPVRVSIATERLAQVLAEYDILIPRKALRKFLAESSQPQTSDMGMGQN